MVVVDAAAVVVDPSVLGVDSTAAVVVTVDVVGAAVVTLEDAGRGGGATGSVVSPGSVVHPAKTTTVNATVAATRNMLRPFTSPHTVTAAMGHRHQASPLQHR